MAAQAQAVQFVRKISTQDLWFAQPVQIVAKAESRNGHLAYKVANQHGEPLTLNVPDWFASQHDENVEVGDYISGGWRDGKFSADIWAVA
jgi:hypothetical protein